MSLTKPAIVPNRIEGINVEQFDEDGACYMAIFVGPDAEKRARDYAEWLSADGAKSAAP